MKKLILSLSLLAAFTAHAGLQTLNLGTNTVVGSSATNETAVASVLTAVNSTDLTLQLSSTSPSANTSTVTWMFNVSVDNTIWQTNALSFSYAAAGTVANGVCTNLLVGQRFPFYQLSYISNAAASVVVTNLNGKLFTKPGI